MNDQLPLSPAAFGRSFKAFLEESVKGVEAEEAPFVTRLAEHLGAAPRTLPIITEGVSTIEHPNVQAALDAWVGGEERSTDLVGVIAEQKRYAGIGLSDLITPARGGLMGEDMVPQPGPVDYANVAVGRDEVRACVQHGLYLLREGKHALAVTVSISSEFSDVPQVRIEVMTSEPEQSAAFLEELRENMWRHNVYRGQVLRNGWTSWTTSLRIILLGDYGKTYALIHLTMIVK